jgi:hypothetical protein
LGASHHVAQDQFGSWLGQTVLLISAMDIRNSITIRQRAYPLIIPH